MHLAISQIGVDRPRVGEEFPEKFGSSHVARESPFPTASEVLSPGMARVYHATFPGGSLDFLVPEDCLDSLELKGFPSIQAAAGSPRKALPSLLRRH